MKNIKKILLVFLIGVCFGITSVNALVGQIENSNSEYEAEADYFAATLLAPFPLFKLLNIQSAIDIQNIFGLSSEASLYRYKQYIKWLHTRVKTAWENDMVRAYNSKH